MPALYPAMSAAEDFNVGCCVRKFVTEWNVTPFTGVVTQISPVAQKVWVQWPTETTSESPETLVKVNPAIYGMPTPIRDMGYNSYEKTLSEQSNGQIPKRVTPSRLPPMRITATDKMAIRIAHTFATDVIGKLVDDISSCKKASLSDIQAYNKIFEKYGNVCSDYIIRSSIEKIYKE